MPDRIQRRRNTGWRMPFNATYVGRPTKYGNPFVPGSTIDCPDNDTAVALYRAWLEHGDTAPYPKPGESDRLEVLRERVLADAHRDLAGRDLACWCSPAAACHADVLLEYLSTGEPR